MSIAPVAPYRSVSRSSFSSLSTSPSVSASASASASELTATAPPANPAVAVRSVLRTVERVLLRDGGHRGALVNARAAVLEGEQRAALRADAWACMERLAGPVE
jgi:hypothetical protein